ncbi:MAG: purQ [Gammaproteobacteria bacterium]|jgi:phosphoribosylformylglycinamidine synthase|nr:purQ [Gammaproteobacteria bacterium]
MISIAVIQFPGSNCERETKLAIERVGMHAKDLLWNSTVDQLDCYDGFVIVGGFSYEDRCRSGLIASKDKLLESLVEQAKLGKPVLGICNGAQILVESGLVPGLTEQRVAMALTHNKRTVQGKVLGTGYFNDWCHIKTTPRANSVFSRHFSSALHVPVAHAEGRFIVPDKVWQALQEAQAEIWQYCDSVGKVVDEFPINPNGSMHNLAGISNACGNVLALMPHPERTANGDAIFASMRDYIKQQQKIEFKEVALELPALEIKPYYLAEDQQELCVQMLINDNEAISVQKALRDMGYKLTVEKFIHWEFDSAVAIKEIAESNELFQSSKERCVKLDLTANSLAFLVREREDMLAVQKQQVLQSQCHLTIDKLARGVIWKISSEQDIKAIAASLISRCILFNPYAHHCYYYQSLKHRGKVRDIYDIGKDSLLILTTNRLSAFDRPIASIPYKSLVLNQLSAWWFRKTRCIIDNHFIDMPSPNSMRVKKCRVFPIEVIVRAFLTGSTSTSIWQLYQKGQRQFFNAVLPDGLNKNTKLPKPIVTPSSKSAQEDKPLRPEDIINADYIKPEQWEYIYQKALECFEFASEIARDKGLILADTKFEFGQDAQGHIILVDECLTPDSSRYWRLDNYEERIKQGLEPESFDKEIVRLWYAKHSKPYKDAILPEAPAELIAEVSKRYIEVYEKLTGQKLDLTWQTQ